MRKHLAALGQHSVSAYFEWCAQHGFAVTLSKSRRETQTELAVIARQQAEVAPQARLHRNLDKLIEGICRGEVRSADIKRPQLQQFCQSIERSTASREARAALQDLLQWVAREADFLLENFTYGAATYPAVNALIKLNDRRGQWVRRIEDWKA